MIFLKNSIKPLITMLVIIIVLTLMATILNYFNIINYKIMNILKVIIPIISFGTGGFIIGKRSENKGWLAGLKLGLIFLITMILFSVLGLRYKLNVKNLIYYVTLLSSSVGGSVLGINKKIN